MTFPSIDVEEVGTTGLLWLIISYGYILYMAANLISEGSELLTLIPQVAGIVGSVVLPLLGAIPDGAIMLFSGLGDIESAQETLSVGVGALAGSTIMLVTLPWSLSVISGRVKFNRMGKPDYRAPKLLPNMSFGESLTKTGVPITRVINHGAISMVLTTIPFFLIQIPASIFEGNVDDLAYAEKNYALVGFILCIIGFITYLGFQFYSANSEATRLRRIAVMKRMLEQGKVSLEAAMYSRPPSRPEPVDEQTSLKGSSRLKRQKSTMGDYMQEVMYSQFKKYDVDNNGELDFEETLAMFADYKMKLDRKAAKDVFKCIDEDGNGTLSFAEIVRAGVIFINDGCSVRSSKIENVCTTGSAEYGGDDDDDDDEEREDIPEDIANLSPEQQQSAIIKLALQYMALGTILCILFSDPMVDCLNEVASRTGIPPFYISFILAPIAANASEIISSKDQAMKKTSKSISVAISTLEGAASMNNTFCLSILLGLIYFRRLAWQYTAETLAIVGVQFVMFLITRKENMTMLDGWIIFAIFPLSIAFVATLESFGID